MPPRSSTFAHERSACRHSQPLPTADHGFVPAGPGRRPSNQAPCRLRAARVCTSAVLPGSVPPRHTFFSAPTWSCAPLACAGPGPFGPKNFQPQSFPARCPVPVAPAPVPRTRAPNPEHKLLPTIRSCSRYFCRDRRFMRSIFEAATPKGQVNAYMLTCGDKRVFVAAA